MKKLVLLSVTLIFMALLMACATRASGPTGQVGTVETQVEAALAAIYERYAGNLILEGAGSYTVVSGDTLSAISLAIYNTGFYYPIIMLASREIVLDPDRIFPDMVLTIPDVQLNLASDTARASIRDFLREIAVIEDQRRRPQTAAGLRNLANSL